MNCGKKLSKKGQVLILANFFCNGLFSLENKVGGWSLNSIGMMRDQ
jgi:hypothetical protein